MFIVKATNESEGISIGQAATLAAARQIGVDAYRTGEIDDNDIIQIWSDSDDVTAVEEFGSDELPE